MARVDQKQFDYYLSLVKGGMKPSEAAKKAYPKGVREPREKAVVDAQKRAEKKGELATLTGAAGTVGGALATKEISDYLSSTGRYTPKGTDTTAKVDTTPAVTASPSPTTTASTGGQYIPPGYTQTDVNYSSVDPSLANSKTVTADPAVDTTSTTTTGTGLTAGQAAQGALGAYQGYQGYQQYKEGDKVGGGLNMVVGANNASGNVLGNAGTYLTAALAAYNAAQALRNDNATGKEKAVAMNKAAGQAVGDFFTWGGLSAAKHAFGKEFGKFEGFVDDKLMKYDPVTRGLGSVLDGKNKGQMIRDKVRSQFKDSGFVDENYNLELAGGKKFDIGADGSIRNYEFDEATKNDPMIGEHLKLVHPLAKILTGGNQDVGGQFAGYFTNAIRSEGDPVENAKKLYERAGITSWEQGRQALRELTDQGKITEEELAVYDQGLANIFGGVPLANVAPKEPKATPEQVGTGAGKAAVSNALLIGRVPKGVDASQGAASIAGVPRLPATQPIIGQGLVDPEYMTEAEKRQVAMMANQRPIARYGA